MLPIQKQDLILLPQLLFLLLRFGNHSLTHSPENSGLPVTFPFPPPHSHALHVHFNLHVPHRPRSCLYPAVAPGSASPLTARTLTTPKAGTRCSELASSKPGGPTRLPCMNSVLSRRTRARHLGPPIYAMAELRQELRLMNPQSPIAPLPHSLQDKPPGSTKKILCIAETLKPVPGERPPLHTQGRILPWSKLFRSAGMQSCTSPGFSPLASHRTCSVCRRCLVPTA